MNTKYLSFKVVISDIGIMAAWEWKRLFVPYDSDLEDCQVISWEKYEQLKEKYKNLN